MDDSVRPVFEAGQVDLVEMDHQVCKEIRFEPTTGHTPGHVSIHISSQGQEALITGDCIHHPCQIEKLDWASSADYDQSASTAAKRFDGRICGPKHPHHRYPLRNATAGYLKSNGSDFWLDVVI